MSENVAKLLKEAFKTKRLEPVLNVVEVYCQRMNDNDGPVWADRCCSLITGVLESLYELSLKAQDKFTYERFCSLGEIEESIDLLIRAESFGLDGVFNLRGFIESLPGMNKSLNGWSASSIEKFGYSFVPFVLPAYRN